MNIRFKSTALQKSKYSSSTINLACSWTSIYVNKLKDRDGNTSTKGNNPLAHVKLDSGILLSTAAKAYTPSGTTSKEVYASISDNIEDWVEEAITIRKANKS